MENDAIGHPIRGGYFASDLNDIGRFDGVDTPSAEAAGEQRQDTGAGAKVQHDTAGPHAAPQSLFVGGHADAIADHVAVAGKRVHGNAP